MSVRVVATMAPQGEVEGGRVFYKPGKTNFYKPGGPFYWGWTDSGRVFPELPS